MFATWPMVVGALVAGVIAGFLIPEKRGAASNAPVPVAKTSEIRAEGPAANADKMTARQPAKPAQGTECEQQTWPYLTANCLDRSARNAAPAITVKTKVMDDITGSLPGAGKVEPVAAKDDAPQSRASVQSEKAAASSTSTAAARDTSEDAVRGEAPAAAPGAGKNQRGTARARADAREKPPRRATNRGRPERRYSDYDVELGDLPERVYIQRGGRLYLAPEYQSRLRPPPPTYRREW